MKVTLDKDYKNWMTVSELERAKQMITEFKTDFDLTPAYYAEQAAREILAAYKADGITDWVDSVLTASAERSGNGRLYDYWGDGTGKLDVWITAKVTTSWGYLELGAYLSDIQSICWNSAGEMACHMYKRYARFDVTEAARREHKIG